MNRRYEEIDIASGIVILLVVIGHLVPFNGYIFRIIFSFHMPFFFLKSGFCFKDKTYALPFRLFLLKRIKSLLAPSLIMNCLILMIGGASVTSFKEGLYFVFVSPNHEWFIMALFVISIIMYWLLRILRKIKDEKVFNASIVLIVTVLPILSSIVLELGIHDAPYIPFKVGSVCIGMMFVLLGYLFKRNLKSDWSWNQIIDNVEKRCLLAITGGIVLILTYFNSYVNIANDYWGRSDIYFLLTAVFWSMIIVVVSQVMEKKASGWILRVVNLLKLLGKNSIIIYLGQSFLFLWFGKIVFKITGNQYTPMVDLPGEWCIVYFIATMVILIPCCIIRNIFKSKKCEVVK